ncbi:MAG: hypothetical protein U0002_18470 [Thermoanaerobaculia bacterium]
MVILALVVFVAGLLAANLPFRKALQALSTEEKGRFLESAVGGSPWPNLVAIGLSLGLVGFAFQAPDRWVELITAAMVLVVASAAASTWTAVGRFRRASLPEAFVRAYTLSRVIRVVTMAVFVALVVAALRMR